MYRGFKVILTICARSGSKGIPGKNLRNLLGKPLIGYTIEQAKKLPWVDQIVISTDSLRIKSIAQKYKIPVPFLRPKSLAGDNSPKISAILHAINKAEKYRKEQYDISIDLDVTSPLRTPEDINNCIKLLVDTPKTKVVFSVFSANRNPYFNMVEQNRNKYVSLCKKISKPVIRRQDAPKVYSLNASIYAAWVKILKKEKTYFTNQTRIYVMPEERSVDIDRLFDFEIVKLLMKNKHEKN